MGFTVIPTNIGGVSLNSLASPLASLLGGTSPINNLIFPSDLGSNPALGHAVIIQAYDYTTTLGKALGQAGVVAGEAFGNAYNNVSAETTTLGAFATSITSGLSALGTSTLALGPAAAAIYQAPSYTAQKQEKPYTTISLYMPETVAINYETHYEEISITKELGIPGILGHAWSDKQSGQLKNTGTGYTTAAAGAALGVLTGSQALGSLAAQGAGIVQNPQIQLLFNSVELRTFQLDFYLTPKTRAEAETVKNICDSFAFYSLPGIAGGQQGQPGQFLTPPQIFSVQFQFLGNSGMLGQISNTLQSALNSTGLNTLINSNNGGFTDANGKITSGTPSKTFSVNDCVLQSVQVDYAPQGWAAYQDGYPVQTHLTLQFKETTMITKNQFKNSAIADNFNSAIAQTNATNAFNDTSNPTSKNFIGI